LDIQDAKLGDIFHDERPDYVNHQAAQVDVRRSVADPIFDAEINVLGSINVFQNCIKHEVKKVTFASSGGAIYGEQDVYPADENHSLSPMSPYGITKLTAEQYLHYYSLVYGLDYTALRYSNVYGPRQDPFGEAGVVAIFIQKMLGGGGPIINGNGRQTRDFVFVGDVARANILALTMNSKEKIFNIGTGVETTINDVFRHLRNVIDPSIEERYGPPKKGEQLRSVIDSTKAAEFLHWNPQISLIDGLRKTCEYFKILNNSIN